MSHRTKYSEEELGKEDAQKNVHDEKENLEAEIAKLAKAAGE